MQDIIQVHGLSPVANAVKESTAEALRAALRSEFAASSFIDYGNHYSTGAINEAINEGMWTTQDQQDTSGNALRIGRSRTDAQRAGESLRPYARLHCAGFISHLEWLNEANGRMGVRMQEVPNGTKVYDSGNNCRGSGKTTLDLTTEADPKYGDIAADTNEAIARAFEGIVKNGDFRNGTSNWAVQNGMTAVDNGNGTVTINGSSTSNPAFVNDVRAVTAGVTYRVVAVIDSLSFTNLSFYVNGSDIRYTEGYNEFTFTPTGNQNIFQFRKTGAASGQAATISHFSMTPVTEEVVTEREDLLTVEAWMERDSVEMYPFGVVQSTMAQMNGIATTPGTRPDGYYAAYKGEVPDKGRSWKLADLTFAELAWLAANPENNIFWNDDGSTSQWRVRNRNIAGMGNGSWNQWSSSQHDYLRFNPDRYVKPQGLKDEAPDFAFSTDGNGIYVGSETSSTWKPDQHVDQGVYMASLNSSGSPMTDCGLAGLCYLLVLGTRQCLNQGAFHHSFNPLGAAAWHEWGVVSDVPWHDSRLGDITSPGQCFLEVTAGNPTAKAPGSGRISDGDSGRDDDRFYDAVYAGGQGGIIDYRLSAYCMGSKEEAAKIFQKVVNGKYRGKEQLVWTGFVGTATHSNSGIQSYTPIGGMRFSIGAVPLPEAAGSSSSNVVGVSAALYNVTKGAFCTNYWFYGGAFYFNNSSNTAAGDELLITEFTDYSVSGEFTMVDVIGDPAEILATPDLASGWLGGWIPSIPSLANNEFYATRKALRTPVYRQYTTNNGTSWNSDTEPLFDTTWNGRRGNYATGQITIWTYTAFAKQTKESTNKAVLNGSEGIGAVYALMWNSQLYGCTFAESLLGKVITNSAIGSGVNTNLGDSGLTINTNGNNLLGDEFGGTANSGHKPVTFGAPNNDSPAVKALWYQTSDNGQVGLNFAYNELVWDSNNLYKLYTANDAPISVTLGDKIVLTGFTNNDVNRVWRITVSGTFGAYGLNDFNGWRYNPATNGMQTMDGRTDFASLRYGEGNMSWGDDSTVRIVDGQSTFTNLNGDACLCGTNELAIPAGYVKNHARVSKQVPGVDLRMGSYYQPIIREV